MLNDSPELESKEKGTHGRSSLKFVMLSGKKTHKLSKLSQSLFL